MLEVLTSPNPLLLQKSQDCIPGDNDLITLSSCMIELMYKEDGIGLAAPQVGILQNIIVVDCQYDVEDEKTRDPIVLVNPKIISTSENVIVSNEGCLSCPGISAPVNRYENVIVEFYDLEGNLNIIEADGLLSTCLQHEIDHLHGKTLFQTCLPEERIRVLEEYNQAKAIQAAQ